MKSGIEHQIKQPGIKQPSVACPSVQVDLTKRRVVDEGEGRLWAESRGFHYFETSAQSGEGINEMFQVHTRYIKTFLIVITNDNQHVCVLSLSRSSPPSPTCARTAGSVRCPRSASASPKSRPTPSDASGTARTPGICWASNLEPRGESAEGQRSLGVVCSLC